jgi:hypothetical protein
MEIGLSTDQFLHAVYFTLYKIKPITAEGYLHSRAVSGFSLAGDLPG